MKTKYATGCAALVVQSLLLSNCATIFGGAKPRDVTLNSTPSGAAVTVTNKKGEVIHKGTTPTTVSLARSTGYFSPASYNVSFTKKGHPQQNVELKGSMNPWYLGNLVFGGLIGFLIVDPLTGAMWTLDEQYTAQMGTMAATDTESASVQIVERTRIPKEWESHLVAIR